MALRSRVSRASAWTGLAVASHVLVVVALLALPVRRGAVVAPRIDSLELDVTTVETAEVAPSPPSDEARATTASIATAATPAEPRVAGAATARMSSRAPVVGNAEPEASAAPTASVGGVTAIPFTAAELGIGPAHNPFLPRAEEKVPTSGPDTPIARAMRGTGLAHDRALGLGPEGPAIAALEGATTSSIAPLRGRASFVVRAGGDGLVIGIDLVDSEGGPGWADAGRLALEQLRGKKLKLPTGARGMNMHIEVRSEMKLPSGQNAPIGGRLGQNDMPEMIIPDVSNIGAKPRRVIQARATGTDVL